MKRLIIPVEIVCLTEDDADPVTLLRQVDGLLQPILGLERVVFLRPLSEAARTGVCRVGDHSFTLSSTFAPDRPVPDLCPAHAYDLQIQEAVDDHQVLFGQVEQLTGLAPYIVQSGGMTMTIVIPLTGHPFESWPAPAYLGLKEGEDDDGRWYGSVGFYLTEDAIDACEEEIVVDASTTPRHPAAWAQLIHNHYKAFRGQEPPA